MKVELLEHFRAFLLRSPFYTSTFMTVREWSEPVLVMRVEQLSVFQNRDYRTRVGSRAWRDHQGTWIVEECLRFVFLSADLAAAEDVRLPWPSAQRTQVRHLLTKIDLTLTGEKSKP